MLRPLAGLLGVAALALAPAQAVPLASFDETMVSFMKKHGAPGGALAVAKDGRLVHAKGYGWADEGERAEATPASLFRIASISKSITAVAVIRLVREGRLDLDAKACALLDLKPDEKGDPRLADITVRHLLHHTGGWDREKSGDPMFRSVEIAEAFGGEPPAGAREIIRWMTNRPLDFTPGTRHAYSNFGYCVLGRIVEKVSAQPYEAYVRKAVLGPMGITRMRLGRSLLKDRAPGEVRYYQPNATAERSVFGREPEKNVPGPYGGFCLEAMDAHGGWIASAVDLARFASSLGKVLDAKGLEMLFAAPPGLKPAPAFYACGWMVRPVGEGANAWHNGSLPGTSTLLVRRHDGLTWVALFNQRSKGDAEIDGALHRAADEVVEWPKADLFTRYP